MTGERIAKANGARRLLEAAVINEQATRNRVDDLEQWAMMFTRLTLWGRLRWLFRGR